MSSKFRSTVPPSLSLVLLASLIGSVPSAYAQSTTSGDVSGTLTDPTGAVVPNATVTVTNKATGVSKTTTSASTGSFRLSLLVPGDYKVTASAAGFTTVSNTVTVAAGAVTADDLKLPVGQSTTTVEVTGEPEVVNTENGDISTAFTAEQVQALPNPGNDLTFIAQTAPGSVMNTGTAAGGYGNFSSFGISGLSNMFTLDGGYENDPFLNLNNTGASNLTLGNNEVDTVTVVSPAFSAQFGGLGGAQVNEITVSGANRVHGDANYYWSGRAVNANDWFNKQNEVFNGEPNLPSFVNANQWSASIGGPIIKDRLFWYVNTEGLRVTTPTSGQVYAPSQAFQNCSLTGQGCDALNAAAIANCEGANPNPNNPVQTNANSTCVGDPNFSYSAFAQAPASQVPLLTRIYNTYNTSPFRPAASAVHADPNDVSAVSYYAQSASFLTEWLLTARVDYKISDKDTFFIHYKQDHGIQPTYVDLVSPLFSASSPQPAWEGQVNETHVFSSHLTNQLVFTGNYYSAPFQNTNNYLPVAPFTYIFEDGDLSNNMYGGDDFAFPQGRRVTGYQVIDDVSYTVGRNTLRLGYNIRRDDVTDLPQSRSVAPEAFGSVESFGAGQVGTEWAHYYPTRSEQPIAVYNMGFYIQNEYKIRPNLTLNAGIRVERNSNPTCITNCLQNFAYPESALPTGTTTPYNAADPGGYILAGRHRAFLNYQKAAVMPRVSFNYQPLTKTVVRGGFGMFSDTFPGSIADTLLSNAPGVFHGIVYGSDLGYAAVLSDPSTAGSAEAASSASNAAFQNAFTSGGNYTTTRNAVTAAGGIYSTPSFTGTAPSISYPTYEEYSLALEQQIDRKSSVSAVYVGNHGYHEVAQNGGFNLSKSANIAGPFFPTVPTAKPITSFGTLTNVYSGASSNYNGVVLSAQRRSQSLTLQFNYEFSHALDEVSNGGLEPFAPDNGDAETIANPNNLHAQYGNADYNIKHNTTGSFVWEVPSYRRYKAITGGFEFSGAVFHQTGLPYTVTQSTTNIEAVSSATGKSTAASFSNGSVNLFARELNTNFDHHCGSGLHALLPDGSNPTPCDFINSFGAPTNFTQQGRNTLTGPSYTNVDFGAFKLIPIPHAESVRLKLGAQFFNFFNHPNFQNPNHNLAGVGGSTYGAISTTVSSPTNIFGSVGANSSPRLIQLHANLTF